MNIYQIVTDKIVSQLEKNIIPWRRPWGGVAGGAINYVSRKPYSLLNQILLDKEGEYLTFKQIQDLKGSIRKSAKSKMVVFYTQVPIIGENEEITGYRPCLRYYNVFHIDDTTGIPTKQLPEAPKHNPLEAAEGVINGYLSRESSLKFINDKPSNRAFYSPVLDLVQVPMMEQYEELGEYYSTTFHEFTHSTMTKSRCDRKESQQSHKFGSEEYSKEELVAEIGSAMLCNIAGIEIEKVFNNSVSYIKGWTKKLKSDATLIFRAASQAEKAVKYITNQNEENNESAI